MPVRHCIRALALLLSLGVALKVPQAQEGGRSPGLTTHGYTVFVSGAVAGREDVTVLTAANGTTIIGQGRLAGSSDVLIRRAEVRYRPDWTPETYELEASVNGGDTALYTTFTDGTATTRGVDGGAQIAHTETVPPQTVVLPNVFLGSYEALTRRLGTAVPGQEFAAFVGAGRQASLRLTSSAAERVQIGTLTIDVRRYALSFTIAGTSSVVHVYADENGALLRISVPAQSVDVMRDDLASATARTVVYSNAGDQAVSIPAAGFTLAATLTWPEGFEASDPRTSPRTPVVVLLAGAAANDRDGFVAGIPILGQLAGSLADAGFLAVRYDKRGHGQSGGRTESATLSDHAEDAAGVVRWLAARRDVDRDRIALVGHNEGGWTALLAAARERRVAAVVTLAAPSTTGAERVLEQQRLVLDRMGVAPAERVERTELQMRINAAVLSGRGWEAIPDAVRKQADTPWFQSILAFDPARVMRDVRQPIFFVHGALDAEVPASHADRLGDLARRSGRPRSVAVAALPGVNHLLTPAETGHPMEYVALQDRHVSRDVTGAIIDWLGKASAGAR